VIRRVFLDTDIILDLLLARKPFFAPAVELFDRIESRTLDGFVSPLVFSNLFYILRKHLPAPGAVVALRKLRLLVRVLPIDERTIDEALASNFRDFEDAIQYHGARAQRLDALVTRNRRDYPTREMAIVTPGECLAMFQPDAK
jgi:predicted nucleic acid-binding protein